VPRVFTDNEPAGPENSRQRPRLRLNLVLRLPRSIRQSILQQNKFSFLTFSNFGERVLCWLQWADTGGTAAQRQFVSNVQRVSLRDIMWDCSTETVCLQRSACVITWHHVGLQHRDSLSPTVSNVQRVSLRDIMFVSWLAIVPATVARTKHLQRSLLKPYTLWWLL